MNMKLRWRFFLISVVYIISGSILCGNMLYTAVQNWRGDVLQDDYVSLIDIKVRPYIIFSGFFIAGILCNKLLGSIDRGSQQDAAPAKVNARSWDFTFYSHGKIIFLLMILIILSWIKYRLF